MKMTRKTKISICVLFYVLFITIFYFSNTIVVNIVGKGLKKADLSSYTSTQPTLYGIAPGDIKLIDPFIEEVSAIGWVYCEVDETNANKVITLIFHSPQNTYAVDFTMHNTKTSIMDRPDLNVKFYEYILPKQNNGFDGTFSVLNMKNGTYTLYIYCKENEESYGIVETDRKFLKENSNFYELD